MRRLFCLIALLTLVACSNIETETLREKPLLLKGVRTYQWTLLDDAAAPPDTPIHAMHHQFRQEIDRIMAAKGYQRVEQDADMELDYRVLMLQEKRELYQADEIAAAEYGVEWRFDRDTVPQSPHWKNQEPREFEFYQKGKLILGVIDRRSGKAIWLRSAEKPITPDEPQEAKMQTLRAIAEKLLDPFPERK